MNDSVNQKDTDVPKVKDIPEDNVKRSSKETVSEIKEKDTILPQLNDSPFNALLTSCCTHENSSCKSQSQESEQDNSFIEDKVRLHELFFGQIQSSKDAEAKSKPKEKAPNQLNVYLRTMRQN